MEELYYKDNIVSHTTSPLRSNTLKFVENLLDTSIGHLIVLVLVLQILIAFMLTVLVSHMVVQENIFGLLSQLIQKTRKIVLVLQVVHWLFPLLSEIVTFVNQEAQPLQPENYTLMHCGMVKIVAPLRHHVVRYLVYLGFIKH